MANEIDVDYFQKIINKLDSKVDYADIRVGDSTSNTITMKDSKIDNVDTGIRFAVGIRVLKNGAWGSAYTTDIKKVEEVAEKATTLAGRLNSDVELTEANPHEDVVESKAKLKINDIPFEEKIEAMKEADSAAQLENIQSVNVTYSEEIGRAHV